MSEFDPLTVPLHGTHLVEAAAGTGKTHSLTALVLRLVGEGAVVPAELALVTFTEAATRELRARVRARLALLGQRLRGLRPPSDDAQLEQLVARWHGDAAVVERVTRALLVWDDAIVATIHAFCRRLLADHALESGSSVVDVEPGDGSLVVQRALADFWRRRVVSATPEEAAWVLGWCESPRELQRWLVEPLRVPPAHVLPLPDPQGFEHLHQELLEAQRAGQVLRADGRLGRAGQELRVAKALSRDARKSPYAHERLDASLQALEAWLGAAVENVDAALHGLRLFMREACLEHKKPSEAPWQPGDAAICAWAEAAYAAGRAYADARRCQFLQAALAQVRGALDVHQRLHRVVTFDDLVTDLKRVLEGPRGATVAAAIQARLKVALVDEFQDTDAEQYAIFRALFHARGDGGLFLIGDPKQAIYRFRGGDVYAYRKAAQDAGANRWTLLRNWRSDARLIDAVNGLFDPRRVANGFVHDFIGFERARAAGTAAPGTAQALTVWTLEGAARPLVKDELRNRLHRAVAARIAQMLRGPAAAPPRIAVLVRDRNDLRGCVDELAQWGISTAQTSEISVYETAEAGELLALLESLADPRDARKARAALATDLLGCDEAALREMLAEPLAWEHALATLAALAAQAVQHGPGALVRELAQRAGPRWLAREGGRRRIANLVQIGELLQREHAALGGLAALVDWLERQRALPDAPQDAEQRAEPGAAAVEVLTIHKAKGLEWDIVFAPYLAFGRESHRGADALAFARRLPVRFHGEQGGVYVDLGSPQWDRHAEREAEETYAETIRVAYVALTRARHHAYTCWTRSTTGVDSPFAWLLHQADGATPTGLPGWNTVADLTIRAALEEWNAAAGGALRLVALPEPEVEPLAPALDADALRARAFGGRIDRRFQLMSYSTLFGGGLEERPDHDQRASAPVPAEPGPVPIEPRGAEFGECVHAILEAIDLRAPESVDAVATIERICRRYGVDEDAEEYVRELVGAAAGAELAPGVTLRTLAPGAARAELEFFFPLHEVELDAVRAALALEPRYARDAAEFAALRPRWHGLMHGYVDLVWSHAGRYGLLDYKTNVLGSRYEDYAAPALARAVRGADYDLQFLIYVVALVRHLRQRLGARFDYARDFAGVQYLFLRGLPGGHGMHRDLPPVAVIDALDRAFGGSAA